MSNADVLRGQRAQVRADLDTVKAKLEGLNSPASRTEIKAYEDKIAEIDALISAEEAKHG